MTAQTAGRVLQWLGLAAMLLAGFLVIKADLVDPAGARRAAEAARHTQEAPHGVQAAVVLLVVGVPLVILGAILRWASSLKRTFVANRSALHIGTVADEDQRAREIAALQQEVAALKRNAGESPQELPKPEDPPSLSIDPEQLTQQEAAQRIEALHRDPTWSKRLFDGDRTALMEMERLRRLEDGKERW